MTDAPPPEVFAPGDDAGFLASYLAGRDTPCPQCGYNLRDLTGLHCPECGQELRVQIALTHPRFGALLLLLVACGSGFGGSLLFTLLAVAQAPRHWWSRTSALVLLGQLALTGVLLAVTLARRRHFRRLEPRTQWRRAGGVLGLVLVLWAIFIATFDG